MKKVLYYCLLTAAFIFLSRNSSYAQKSGLITLSIKNHKPTVFVFKLSNARLRIDEWGRVKTKRTDLLYTQDDEGRVIGVEIDGVYFSLGHDSNGYLSNVSDGYATYTLEYNANYRVARITNGSYALDFQYDSMGLTSRIFSANGTVDLNYGPEGRFRSMIGEIPGLTIKFANSN